MHRMFAAVLLAASTLGTAVAPSSASAAVVPGPNAIPSADLVRSVDPAVTAVEQAGYRRHWDDDFDFHPKFRRRHHFDDDFDFHPRFRRKSVAIVVGAPLYHYHPYPRHRRCVVRHTKRWSHWGPVSKTVRVCRGYNRW
jgi:hypothetical protein